MIQQFRGDTLHAGIHVSYDTLRHIVEPIEGINWCDKNVYTIHSSPRVKANNRYILSQQINTSPRVSNVTLISTLRSACKSRSTLFKHKYFLKSVLKVMSVVNFWWSTDFWTRDMSNDVKLSILESPTFVPRISLLFHRLQFKISWHIWAFPCPTQIMFFLSYACV